VLPSIFSLLLFLGPISCDLLRLLPLEGHLAPNMVLLPGSFFHVSAVSLASAATSVYVTSSVTVVKKTLLGPNVATPWGQHKRVSPSSSQCELASLLI
jgi:hypothetical protein